MEATSTLELGAPKSSPMLPSIKRFLEALPEIPIENLSEENKSCNICMEQFTDDDDNVEKPVSLRCGHVFGSFCIRTWVMSSNASQPTCPMCRANLTSPSGIERWEYFTTLMQQQPYTSLTHSLRRTGTPALENCDSAVELVSLFFQVVMQMLAHHRRHRIPASAFLLQSAQAVASRMGRLFVLLEDTMLVMGATVPWDERGPPVVAILRPEYESMFGMAFERMAQMERRATSEWAINI